LPDLNGIRAIKEQVMPRTFKIHPSIGIARLGNSANDWFDGPEVPDPDFAPPPNGLYRDTNQRIRRQAVRFRIYEYDYGYGYPFQGFADQRVFTPPRVREITDRDAEIQWHVHLANLKSFTNNPTTGKVPAPNDPGVKTLTAPGQTLNVSGRVLGVDVQLGTLMTDTDGTLRVLGGSGRSESPSGAPLTGLFNAGWFDDVSDGPVLATIRLRNSGEMPAVEPAWAVVGVPAFAQPIVGIVSLYDLAYDIAVQHFGLIPPSEVSFTRDIFPVLERPVLMQWVDADARQGHGPGRPGDFLEPVLFDLLRNNDPTIGSPARQARERVFARLKNPAGGGPGDMPRLNGLTLTKRQYELFRRWSIGDFLADWHGVPVSTPFDQLPPSERPSALDQASLWKGVGGAFSPGIEVGSHFADYQTFEGPFRIKGTLPAGHLTSTLSVPWQSDYAACGWGWWPSGRPNFVTPDGTTFRAWASFAAGESMPTAWWKLGFLAKRTLAGNRTAYLETERV
jgi:hypothetical protein